jgi:hypothetical protein
MYITTSLLPIPTL